MSEIKVSCNDQVLKITDAPVLAAGGLNEVKVVFTFCEKWTGYVKTATFWRDADNIYFAVLDENDTCVVPWEVCYEEGTFFFGVFGEKQNSRRTSTTMRYKTKDGAISSEMLPSDPTPEVYDQIMALVAESLERSNTISEDAEKAIEAAKQATADALSAKESANNSATNASRAAEEANKAATAASNASNAVSTAVDNAIIATNNANNAVDRANSATNNASAAAVNASSAAVRADDSARSANTAAIGANSAKGAADEAAQKANNAADSANASANNAATEANRASIAASSANNAATEARAAAETATNTFNGFVEDVASTLEDIHNLVTDYVDAPAIVCEASGETITIADASDQPLRGLKLYGKTTQDGTPTPENPVELKNAVVSKISSVGRNLYEGGDLQFVGYTEVHLKTPLLPGTYTLSGYATSTDTDSMYSLVTFLGGGENGANAYSSYERDKYTVRQITLVNPVSTIRFSASETIAESQGDSATITEIMLNYGTTALPYEPYKGGSITLAQPVTLPGIPVSSGGNYTDANGQQWICDEMDFARGVYVQRFRKIILDGVNVKATSGDFNYNPHYVSYGIYDAKPLQSPMSSHFKGGLWNTTPGYCEINRTKTLTIFPTDTNISSVDAFNAWLVNNPVTFIYELETPVETPISETDLTAYRTLHTNKPNTTVYTDSNAGMTVGYAADTKTYIDNKFAELATAILQNA